MKILYVSDLDGTLLTSQTTLSNRSRTLLNGLIARGMLFTYATARSMSSAQAVTKGLSVTLPAVVYNGAMLCVPPAGTLPSILPLPQSGAQPFCTWKSACGRILSLERFSPTEQAHIIRCLESHPLSTMVYAFVDGAERVSYRTDRVNDALAYYLESRRGDSRLRPVSTAEALYEGSIFYFTNIGDRKELQPIYAEFQRDPAIRCTFQQELYRPEYWCELMPGTATKAHGLRQLKERLGCQRVVCFGDAINDIPLFEAADACYAVENAVPELKAIATGIIPGNDADGVARWLAAHAEIPPRPNKE